MAKIQAKTAAAIAITDPNFELTEPAREATGGTEFAELLAEVAAADPVFEAEVDLDLVPLEVAVVDPEVLAADAVLDADPLVEETVELMVN